MAHCELNQPKKKSTSRPVLQLARTPKRFERRVPVMRRVLPAFQHTRYIHPYTGAHHFGFVPAIAGLQPTYAPIVLTHGWQSQKHSGMGAHHIWYRHSGDAAQHGAQDITCFVADIIQQGTPIFRLQDEHGEARLAVYRSGVGIVVLGPKRQGTLWRWTVITAYKPTNFIPTTPVAHIEMAQGFPDLQSGGSPEWNWAGDHSR